MDFKNALPQLKFTHAANQQRVVDNIFSNWEATKNGSIVHFMYYASYIMIQKNEQFLKSMLLADYILIDGIGFQTYFKFLMGISVPNMNGTDLSPILIQSAKEKKIPIAFYGTTKEQIKLAAENQNRLFGANTIYYAQDGYSPLIWENIKPNSILMVGMGSPLQENWVFNNQQQIRDKNILVVTVGGFFDFASGFYVRAPKWVREIRFEWAWRTMLHPARHYKKRLRDTTIIFKPFVDKLKGYHKLVRFIHFDN